MEAMMDEFESVEVEIVKIKSTQDRILSHHLDFKEALSGIKNSIDGIKGIISQKESESRERDTGISKDCQDEIKSIYRAVAVFGISSLMTMAGAVIAYLVNK